MTKTQISLNFGNSFLLGSLFCSACNIPPCTYY
jgi:hypothetical protein